MLSKMETFYVQYYDGDTLKDATLKARSSEMLKGIIKRIQYDKSKSIYIKVAYLEGVEGKI